MAAKQIIFTDGGKDYTLEFTRKSIETMERQGFNASEITDKPVLTLPALFAGAFIANHKYIKRDVVDKLFDKMTNRGELISKLSVMYNEPIAALMDDPEEDSGNVQWEGSW